jgi:hypothetical protein
MWLYRGPSKDFLLVLIVLCSFIVFKSLYFITKAIKCFLVGNHDLVTHIGLQALSLFGSLCEYIFIFFNYFSILCK